MSFSSNLTIDVSVLSPVAATAFAWHISGAIRVTVIAKATFEIVPSTLARVRDPEPLCTEDAFDATSRTLRAANDMVPHLPNAGIVLLGSAYMPAGVDHTTVSLGIHRYGWLVHKRVIVPCPRMASASERIVRVSLASAGFGPIAASSSPRREIMPQLIAHPSGVPQLPSHLDFRCFQAAPADQQCAYVEGDEWIMLEGVHPSLNLVRTQLPSTHAEARLWLPPSAESAASERGMRLVADTLVIDADRMVLQMVWRGHIEVSRTTFPVGMTAYVGLSRPDAPVDFPRRPPRAKPVLAGTTAVSDQEIARSREAAAAPFRIGGPDASRGAGSPIPGSPFQFPGAAPHVAVPVPIAEMGTVAITPPPVIVTPVIVENERSTAPNDISIPLDASSEGTPGRKRPRPALAQTLEQRDKPPARPIAPFAIADAGVAHGPTAPIPGAPFLPHPIETSFVEHPSVEFVPVEPLPIAEPIPSPAAFETPAAEPIVSMPPSFVSEPMQKASAPLAANPPPPSAVLPEPAAPTLRDTVASRVRAGAPLHDLNLVGADLSEMDLSGARLSQQNLRDVRFAKSKLTGAELAGADLTNADFAQTNLSGADLTDARLMRANLTEAQLVGASLERADLSGATLTQARFDQARLVATNLSSVQAQSASFRGASLGGADFRAARCAGAVFDDASLENLVAGRADFTGARFVRASLMNAALRGARMPGAILAFANVAGADLRDVDLRGANVYRVDRSTAKFAGANLRDIVDIAPPDPVER